MQSPLLPWEVIERVIGHSGDHPRTLYNLSFTCRQLRPRALCMMVSHADLKNREQIFHFCDFLNAEPQLKPLVRSISLNPVDFAPVPLLQILPNLSEISFISNLPEEIDDSSDDDFLEDADTTLEGADTTLEGADTTLEDADTTLEDADFTTEDDDSSQGGNPFVDSDSADGDFELVDSEYGDSSEDNDAGEDRDKRILPIALHQASRLGCQKFGTHVQTLHLSQLSFRTYLQFSDILLAFTNITHLTCMDVIVHAENSQGFLEGIKRRMTEKLQQLHTIDISWRGRRRSYYDTVSVGALLVDSGFAHSIIESLVVTVYRSSGLSQSFDWPRLRSLVLRISLRPEAITNCITFLKDFHCPALRDVSVELHEWLPSISGHLAKNTGTGLYEELEQILLKFAHPRIIWIVFKMRASGKTFWIQEFGEQCPLLFQRGALSVRSHRTLTSPGHNSPVLALIASPDSRWVASGSADGTLILWDTGDGGTAQQWVAHGYDTVMSLAFSPDSRYLVSGGGSINRKAIIWDLDGGLWRQVTVLVGHTEAVESCAWSPCGGMIASGSRDATVRLWDAHTFQQLHVFEDHAQGVTEVKFSPNGRWLVSADSFSVVHIWHMALRELYMSVQGGFQTSRGAVAFDPESERIVVAAAEHGAIIVDVKTCRKLLDLSPQAPSKTDLWALWRGKDRTNGVAFSRDGKMVLTADKDGTKKVWNASTGVELFSLKGNWREVSQASFSPCGKYIASGSKDKTIHLWRTKDGSCMAAFKFSEYTNCVRHVVFSPDGKTLSCGDEDGTIIFRHTYDIIPVDGHDA